MDKFQKLYSRYMEYIDGLGLENHEEVQLKYRMLIAFRELGLKAPPPSFINLGVNNVCNFKCKMCDFGQENKDTFYYKFNVGDKKGGLELPPGRIKGMINEVAWFRPVIRIDYLEPSLWPPLMEFIRYVKSQKLRVWLLTNAYTMTEEKAEEYIDVGVDLIRLSLNGPKEVHDDICGRPGAYDKVIQTIKWLTVAGGPIASGGPDVGVYFTLQNDNYKHMYDTVKCLSHEGVLPHIFFNFQWMLFATKEMAEEHNKKDGAETAKITEQCLTGVDLESISLELIDAQVKKIKAEFPKARIHFRPTFDRDMVKKCLQTSDELEKGLECLIPWYSCSIAPSGDMNFFQHCFLEPLGNIIDEDFMSIWNGPKAEAQRALLKEKGSFVGCRRCWGVYNILDQRRRYGDE